jgi:uncharacterized membrane protein
LNLKDPETMNVVIGRLLRYGVMISAVVVIIGVARLVVGSGYSDTSGLLVYNPNAIPHGNFDVSLGGFFHGLSVLDPYSLIELGVLLLIATPVSRVLVSVFLFSAEGDRKYVAVTAVVLTLLLFSMLVTPFIPGFHA